MPSATAGPPPTKTLIHPCAKLRSSSIRPEKTTHFVSGGNMLEANEGDQGASSASSQHMVDLSFLPYHLPYVYKSTRYVSMYLIVYKHV